MRHERTLVLAAAALFACRLLVALAAIPPWQQPDEPTHVARAELYRSQVAASEESADPAREAEILQSMANHRWWEHRDRGFPLPAEIPSSFDTATVRVGGPIKGYTGAYPVWAGRLLSWIPRLPVDQEMYVLRATSLVLALLSLWVIWLGARAQLGPSGGAVVAMLLAVQPQFAISSAAASPDPVAILFGGCVWWQAVLVITRPRVGPPLAAMWLAAVAAAASDRVGVPLLPVALIVSIVAIGVRARLGGGAVRTIAFTVAGGLAVVLVTWWALGAFGQGYSIAYVFSRGLTPVPGAISWDRLVRFTSVLHQSWWYSLGWGRYSPPGWWIAAVTAISATAVLGIGRVLPEAARNERRRTLLMLAAAAVAVQLAAVYWTYFRLGVGAQGRYLFPVLAPSLVLFWTGIEAWVPPSRRMHAAAAVLLLIASLDVSAWMLVAIPAYYASF